MDFDNGYLFDGWDIEAKKSENVNLIINKNNYIIIFLTPLKSRVMAALKLSGKQLSLS